MGYNTNIVLIFAKSSRYSPLDKPTFASIFLLQKASEDRRRGGKAASGITSCGGHFLWENIMTTEILRQYTRACKLLVLVFFLGASVQAQIGKIVVNWDDWTLSDAGFSPPNDAGTYVQNIASWFLAANGRTVGSFIGYGTLFHLTGNQLRQAFESAGHTWTVSGESLLSLDSLQKYDGVFLGASPIGNDTANITALTNYVLSGGNVYIFGGTDFYGTIQDDAAVLNAFLYRFGIAVANFADGVVGSPDIDGYHEILLGVTYLYGINGMEIFDLSEADSHNAVVGFYGTEGLVGVSQGLCCNIAGDANDDGTVNIGDAVFTINYIFKGGPPPPCLPEGDANCDMSINIADSVYLINYIFKGGPEPVADCCL